MKESGFSEFVNATCQELSVEDFVGMFFKGNVTKAAEAFNVSRQTMHSWLNDDSYEIQVIYHKFNTGKTTYDYIIKKEVKRVGAISDEFHAETGYVYAISSNGITKIGRSRTPLKRMKEVAKEIGFDDYESFISNRSTGYKTAEKNTHKALADFKRENTIYQREVFSCDIKTAIEAIERALPDVTSGPRVTTKSIADTIITGIKPAESIIVRPEDLEKGGKLYD